jgi:uncharacterized membrane protein
MLVVVLIAEMALLWAALPPVADRQSREPEARTIVVEVRDRGFHWADAGIGALALAGIGLAAAGVTVTIRRAGSEQTHRRTNEERP